MGKARNELAMIRSALQTAGLAPPPPDSDGDHPTLSWVTMWLEKWASAEAAKDHPRLTDAPARASNLAWAALREMAHVREVLGRTGVEEPLAGQSSDEGKPYRTLAWLRMVLADRSDSAEKATAVGRDAELVAANMTQLRAIRAALEAAGIPEPSDDGTPSHTMRWVKRALEMASRRSRMAVVIPRDAPTELARELRAVDVTPTDIPPLEMKHVYAVVAMVKRWERRMDLEVDDPDRWEAPAEPVDTPPTESAKVNARLAAGQWISMLTPTEMTVRDLLEIGVASGVPQRPDDNLVQWFAEIVDTLTGYRQEMERTLADRARADASNAAAQ